MSELKEKGCPFCSAANFKIDYKRTDILAQYVTDRGKIFSRRISGACARHQRQLAIAVKRARMLALLPYTTIGQ